MNTTQATTATTTVRIGNGTAVHLAYAPSLIPVCGAHLGRGSRRREVSEPVTCARCAACNV